MFTENFLDEEIIKTQMVYRTKEEAEFYLKKQQLLTQYKRYLLDHEEEAINWEDIDEPKYCAWYDFENQEIDIYISYYCKIQGVIYTTRKESITEFIKEIGELTFIKYILIGEYVEVEND